MEQDPEYRQAVLDEGYDPDDPHTRRAIAGVGALLREVGFAERTAHHEIDDTSAPRAPGSTDAPGARTRREVERETAWARRESVTAES